MKKFKALIGRLAASNHFLKVFSLVLAFLVWLAIVYSTDDKFNRTIEDVPITWVQPSALTRQELNVISVEPQTVDVEVRGVRYVVEGLTSADLEVSVQLGSIVTAGTQRVSIISNTESSEFTIDTIKPAQASVRVDHMDTKTLTVQANVTGVDLAEGYIKEEEIVTPETIEVTGPIGDLNKVEHAVVNVDVGRTLSATESASGDILLLDADGNEVQSEYIKKSYDTAEVTIPVLKRKRVDVGIEFNNIPPFFPTEELSYSFSAGSVEIAGPATLVDSYDKITLGYVDFKTMGPGARQVFDVLLPSGFVNVNNIQSISVSFDTDDFETRTFSIPEIQVVNAPANYEIAVNPAGATPRDVTMVGPRDVLETMTSEDLVAQVDLSGRERELVTGQTRMPVTIFAPTKGTVWAYGDYVTILDIAEP